MEHLMIDLETLSTRPDAAILSIGAVFFDLNTGQHGHELHVGICMDEDPRYGHITPNTVGYWLAQSLEARAELLETTAAGLPLLTALHSLTHFFHLGEYPNQINVWANGAAFDPVILESACRRFNINPPWNYWQLRDVRTIVALGRNLIGYDPKHDNPFEGTRHNALADAIHQAQYVSDIYRRLQARLEGTDS